MRTRWRAKHASVQLALRNSWVNNSYVRCHETELHQPGFTHGKRSCSKSKRPKRSELAYMHIYATGSSSNNANRLNIEHYYCIQYSSYPRGATRPWSLLKPISPCSCSVQNYIHKHEPLSLCDLLSDFPYAGSNFNQLKLVYARYFGLLGTTSSVVTFADRSP